MAQTFYDPLGLDNQSSLAVHSILDSQTVGDVGQDEDDLFQCGKCKQQFSILGNFVLHKQNGCMDDTKNLSTAPLCGKSEGSLAAEQLSKVENSLTPVTLPQNILLTDDLMSLTGPLTVATSIGPMMDQQPSPCHVRNSNSMSSSHLLNSNQNGPLPSIHTMHSERLQLNQTGLSQNIQSGDIQHVVPIVVQGENKSVGSTKGGLKGRNNSNTLMVTDMETGITVRCKRTKATGQEKVRAGARSKLECQYCKKGFTKNFDLLQHVRSHTGEKPFQCIVCGRAFAQKSNVKKHMQTHKVWPKHREGTLPEQPEPVEDSGSIEKSFGHLRPEKVHSNEELGKNGKVIVIDNSFVCQYCNEKFSNYYQLKSHMKLHKSQQLYKCVLPSCGETFYDMASFLDHTRLHEHEMVYNCHMCSKSFSSLLDLGVHQYSHSLYPTKNGKHNPRSYRCLVCGNKYSSSESLGHHLNTTTHKFACKFCDKIFTCERFLRRHLPIHTTVGEFQCIMCKKRFKTEHSLKVHSVTHSSVKPFACELCGSSFNRKDKLTRHSAIHSDQKRFPCPLRTKTGCTKAFHRSDRLKTHLLVHSKVRPFSCVYCPKSYFMRGHLLDHMKTHSGKYDFVCDTCGRGFQRQKHKDEHKCNSQNVHRRVHRIKRRPGRPTKANAEDYEDTKDPYAVPRISYLRPRTKRQIAIVEKNAAELRRRGEGVEKVLKEVQMSKEKGLDVDRENCDERMQIGIKESSDELSIDKRKNGQSVKTISLASLSNSKVFLSEGEATLPDANDPSMMDMSACEALQTDQPLKTSVMATYSVPQYLNAACTNEIQLNSNTVITLGNAGQAFNSQNIAYLVQEDGVLVPVQMMTSQFSDVPTSDTVPEIYEEQSLPSSTTLGANDPSASDLIECP